MGTQPNGLLFKDILSASGAEQKKREDTGVAAAAVEMLRLEMMKSALSLSDSPLDTWSATGNQPIKALLARFFEQSQQTTAPPQSIASGRNDTVAVTVREERDSSLEGIIHKAARRYGVEESLIKAVIKAESNFNPKAVSHAGAEGLMQLMPATARGLGVTDSFDPEQNIMAGTRFLKDMLNRYDGNLDAALAAYNWGPGNVDKKGASLPRETRQYLATVKSFYSQFSG
ncbi:MAG: lytic [Geobacteraceae bacterium]|nr:MAG: lytic [Geobacteraceae bacterium]